MARPQRLTKSRFTLGCQCPTKLVYAADPATYPNAAASPFLEALARGGYQVGALAKVLHAGGVEVVETDEAKAVAATNELLARDAVTVFEAAIAVPADNLFVRTDVLQKNGARLDVIEVKAKSWDPAEDGFWKKRGHGLRSEWEPYLRDVAFQAWVLRRAFPRAEVHAALMLVNKAATCTVDGLHQRFLARKSEDAATGRARLACTVREGPAPSSRGGDLLIRLPADREVRYLHEEWRDERGQSFAETVGALAAACARGEPSSPKVGGHCKQCEFRVESERLALGQKSGLAECWSETFSVPAEEIQSVPLVIDLWNIPSSLVARQLEQRHWRLRDLAREPEFSTRPGSTASLKASKDRQCLHVVKAAGDDTSPHVDAAGLRKRFAELEYPLHFIDFETATVAIPFVAERRPYELLAFQFSHHVLPEDGTLEHRAEFLDAQPGSFPNYRFVRALAASLRGQRGTFVHFAAHENTVLRQIRQQLSEDPRPPEDRDDLVAFLEHWASPPDAEWTQTGRRVDLRDWILEHFYDPAMGGSYSIKAVLPAVMRASGELERRYGRPVYGAANGIPSRNFRDMQWFVRDGRGGVRDPYELLGPIFSDADEVGFDERLFEGDELREGGAATTAWTRMQFEDMSSAERESIRAALLRYCELDTLAMALVFEHLRELARA